MCGRRFGLPLILFLGTAPIARTQLVVTVQNGPICDYSTVDFTVVRPPNAPDGSSFYMFPLKDPVGVLYNPTYGGYPFSPGGYYWGTGPPQQTITARTFGVGEPYEIQVRVSDTLGNITFVSFTVVQNLVQGVVVTPNTFPGLDHPPDPFSPPQPRSATGTATTLCSSTQPTHVGSNSSYARVQVFPRNGSHTPFDVFAGFFPPAPFPQDPVNVTISATGPHGDTKTATVTVLPPNRMPTFSITDLQLPIDGVQTTIPSPAPVQVLFTKAADPLNLVLGKATAFFVGVKVDQPALVPSRGVEVQVTFGDAPPLPSVFVMPHCLQGQTTNCFQSDGTGTVVLNSGFAPQTLGNNIILSVVNPSGANHIPEADGSTGGKSANITANVEATNLQLTYFDVQCPSCPGYGTILPAQVNQTIADSNAVILATYPVPEAFSAPHGASLPGDASGNYGGIAADLLSLWAEKSKLGKNRALGIVSDDYFTYHNYTKPGFDVAGLVLPDEEQTVGLIVAGTRTTAAHELGHTLGIQEEEYAPTSHPGCVMALNGLCRGNMAGGFWVDGNIAIGSNPLVPDHFCFMGQESSGFLTSSGVDALSHTWVDTAHYNYVLSQTLAGVITDPEVLLVTAIVFSTGGITLKPWYTLAAGALTASRAGDYSIEVLDSKGQILNQTNQSISFTAHLEPFGIQPTDAAPLMAAVPFPANAFSVAILHGGQVISTANVTTKLLVDAINSVPDSGFDKNASERRNALLNKIAALDVQLSAGAVNGAEEKLENDIGKSIENWLVDGYTVQSPLQYTKQQVLALVDELLQHLKASAP